MLITIQVHANNRKKSGVEKDMFDNIHVYTNATPIDGEANRAVIKLLAEHYDVASSLVSIIKGHTNKIKVVQIDV